MVPSEIPRSLPKNPQNLPKDFQVAVSRRQFLLCSLVLGKICGFPKDFPKPFHVAFLGILGILEGFRYIGGAGGLVRTAACSYIPKHSQISQNSQKQQMKRFWEIFGKSRIFSQKHLILGYQVSYRLPELKFLGYQEIFSQKIDFAKVGREGVVQGFWTRGWGVFSDLGNLGKTWGAGSELDTPVSCSLWATRVQPAQPGGHHAT